MKNTHCRCVFPSPTEQELATVSGQHPGTAIRVCAETGQDGYVRLEQLAHDKGLGWYVQKSFTVPADLLSAVAAQLRKADCLMPRRCHCGGQDAHVLFPAPMLRLDPSEAQRREA